MFLTAIIVYHSDSPLASAFQYHSNPRAVHQSSGLLIPPFVFGFATHQASSSTQPTSISVICIIIYTSFIGNNNTPNTPTHAICITAASRATDQLPGHPHLRPARRVAPPPARDALDARRRVEHSSIAPVGAADTHCNKHLAPWDGLHGPPGDVAAEDGPCGAYDGREVNY